MSKYMTEKNVETLIESLKTTPDFLTRVHIARFFTENLGLVPIERSTEIMELVKEGVKK